MSSAHACFVIFKQYFYIQKYYYQRVLITSLQSFFNLTIFHEELKIETSLFNNLKPL